MKRILVATALMAMVAPAMADEDPSPEAVERINTLLAEMTCEIDEDNIELEDGGYDLDDVLCADGQYDITLDADFNVTGKRKE